MHFKVQMHEIHVLDDLLGTYNLYNFEFMKFFLFDVEQASAAIDARTISEAEMLDHLFRTHFINERFFGFQ